MNYRKHPRGNAATVAIVEIFFVAIFLVTMIFQGFQIVPPNHLGIVIKGGSLQEATLPDGFYLKIPFWTKIVPVDISDNTTDSKTDFEDKEGGASPFRNIAPLSKDGQKMNMDAQIGYRIVDPIKYRNRVGNTDPRSIEALFFIPNTRRLVYDYASEYSWKDLIQGGGRQEFGQRLYNTMTTGVVTKKECKTETKAIDKLTGVETIVEAQCSLNNVETINKPEDYGVAITMVNMKKIEPNQNIIAAVEEAQKKEQEVKIAQQEKEIAREQADKKIEVARGESGKVKLEKEAQAYQKQVEMEANAAGIKAEALAKMEQAKAERELANALRESEGLIDYKRLDIEMILAEAQLEFAKHYTGQVPQTVNVVGTEEAQGMKLLLGLPSLTITE